MWFGLQIVEILNHVPTFSRQEHNIYQTTCPHSTNHLQHHSTKGQHDTLYGSIGLQFKQPTFCDILPFRNYTATSHYPVFTDKHSLLYGMLTFLLHFMTNTFLSTFLPLSPPPLCFHLVSDSYSQSNPVHATIAELSYQKNFSDPTSIFPQSFT